MSSHWKSFCSRYPNTTLSNGDIQLWIPEIQDFGECFHDLYHIVTHIFLLIFTSVRIGSEISRRYSRRPPRELRWNFRKSWIFRLAGCFGILAVISTRQIILLATTSYRKQLGTASHVLHGVSFATWVLVMMETWFLLRTTDLRACRPTQQLVHFLFYIPVAAGYVFELWSGIGGIFVELPGVYRICAYLLFTANIVIICSYIPPILRWKHRRSSLDGENLIEQETDWDIVRKAYKTSNVISKIFLFWVTKLIRKGGFIRTNEHLIDLPENWGFRKHGEIFRERLHSVDKVSNVFLIKILWGIWGWMFVMIGGMMLFSVVAEYAEPVILQKLVAYFESGEGDIYEGLQWAGLLVLSNAAGTLFHAHYGFLCARLTMQTNGVLIDSVYRKLFRSYGADLSSAELSGKVVNLIGTDCERVSYGTFAILALISAPLQIGIGLYLLYWQMGISFLGGIGVVVLLLIVNQVLAARIAQYEDGKQAAADKRVKVMREIINCIRIIKFHAWESFFRGRAVGARDAELKFLRKNNILAAVMSGIWPMIPLGMAVTTFLIYVLLGNQLTAAKVFPSIAVFRMLNAPLMMMSWQVISVVDMWVSSKRLQEFFRLSDLSFERLYALLPANHASLVDMKAATFSCQTSEKVFHGEPSSLLDHVSLRIKWGDFVGIAGKIGSGKSVLLNAVIGEMHKLNGELGLNQNIFDEGFAFVPQEPWIFQGTVRQNILFGDDVVLDPLFYRQVLECCCLTGDLENMPNGDATQIGEKGVTLSGGQKARVALARAVYQRKRIILLDDPLAAVDPHVAASIYNMCILGLLKDTTKVFITHNTEHLRKCDRVVVMADGRIAADGPPEQVLNLPEARDDSGAPNNKRRPSLKRGRSFQRQKTVDSEGSSENDEEDEDEEDEVAALVEDEESETGVVKPDVYFMYFRAMGWLSVVAIWIFMIFGQAGANACDIWISYWISHHGETNDSVSVKEFLYVYGGLASDTALCSFIWPFILFFGALKASNVLHNSLLNSLFKATIQFFDSTPSGRILNRFSKDINNTDEHLPLYFLIFHAELFGLIGALVVICYSMPWFLLVLLPMAAVYFFMQKYYRYTSRELKRLNAVTQSPMYTLYSETLHGLPVIRSMRMDEKFCSRFSAHLSQNIQVQFSEFAAEQWFALWLSMIGMVLVSGVMAIGFAAGTHSAAFGLALSYAISMVELLEALVDSFTHLENEMVHVERIKQYIDDVKPERMDGVLMTQPNWPDAGAIDIDDLSVRYRDDLPDVLDGIKMNIQPGEKVGIVGRTGAGKSSLMLALFRMVEAHSGSISIDGVRISYLDLQHLRSKLTIIPQTACLFDASIRDNLDPLAGHTDDEVWRVVDICHLRPFVEKLGNGLGGEVGENGKNLSAGEKQLVSLARALLSKSKIVCLDEATANIDYETDMLIQQTIREALTGSTILTIAHRVQTVLDCDRIVVMANGRICEEGSPGDLMQRPESRFFQMVEQSRNAGEL